MLNLGFITDVISLIFIVAGALQVFFASVGINRFRSTLARVHAVTKPQTVGLIMVIVGVIFRLIGDEHFDVRPAAKWGTIEVRISDAATNLRELAGVVALTHCLVVLFDDMLDHGLPLPTLQPWHVAENKWRGARYGLEAEIITSRDTDERLVTDDLRDLVEQLQPIAERLGCVEELGIVNEIIDGGATYQRQRAVFETTGDWRGAVDQAVEELRAGHP